MKWTVIALFAALLAAMIACGDPTGIAEQETGTWTPVADGGTTTTYKFQHGTWARTATVDGQYDKVWVNGEIWIDKLGDGSAQLLAGLPFESIDGDEPSGVVSDFKNLNVVVSSLSITIRPASRNIAFHAVYPDPAKGPNSYTLAPLQDGTRVFFTAEYLAKKP